MDALHKLPVPQISFPDPAKKFPAQLSRESVQKIEALHGLGSDHFAPEGSVRWEFPVFSLLNREIPVETGSYQTAPSTNQSGFAKGFTRRCRIPADLPDFLGRFLGERRPSLRSALGISHKVSVGQLRGQQHRCGGAFSSAKEAASSPLAA